MAVLKRQKILVRLLLERTNNGSAILSRLGQQLQDLKKQAFLEAKAETKAEASTVLTGLRTTTQERQMLLLKIIMDERCSTGQLSTAAQQQYSC